MIKYMTLNSSPVDPCVKSKAGTELTAACPLSAISPSRTTHYELTVSTLPNQPLTVVLAGFVLMQFKTGLTLTSTGIDSFSFSLRFDACSNDLATCS